MTSVNIAHTGRFDRLARLGSLLARMAIRIHRRRQLMGLLHQPDHILKDIGLQRHEITREGLKQFWVE
jgi:uncharacterized protein YjiS (DUF1127 family)